MIVGSVPLVPPAIDENFETILGWADELRRLKVRANADRGSLSYIAKHARPIPAPRGARVPGRRGARPGDLLVVKGSPRRRRRRAFSRGGTVRPLNLGSRRAE